MRKAIAFFIAAAAICLGIVGAVGTIPHAHCEDGGDPDHSSCPLCQFAVHGFSATFYGPGHTAILLLAAFCPPVIESLFAAPSCHRARSRSPPVHA